MKPLKKLIFIKYKNSSYQLKILFCLAGAMDINGKMCDVYTTLFQEPFHSCMGKVIWCQHVVVFFSVNRFNGLQYF